MNQNLRNISLIDIRNEITDIYSFSFNVDDDFMRLNSTDMREQLSTLVDSIRFDQNPSIIAKLGCGKLLDADDINFLESHMEVEREYLEKLKKNGY